MKDIRVALVSLGCAKNLVDSETMLGLLEEENFVLIGLPDEADVIIINTCGFIDAAKEESIDKILEMASLKEKNCKLLLAAGCMAQRYADELLKELPELDGLVGVNDVHGIAEAIKQGLTGEKVSLVKGTYKNAENSTRILATPKHSAYLKIAEGCDNRCTYCAIPAIRGPYQSRKVSAVVKEATELAKSGVKELNLIAQDITCYGEDLSGKLELGRLLKDLVKIPDISWIRLLYAYPERLDERIISVIADEEKVCNYLDIPIQHGSDSILKMMGRKTTAEETLTLIAKLRQQVPGIILRSSFIVGFPGESDEDFAKLLSFLKDAQLDRVGFFAYSQEEGTAAAKFEGQLPKEIKEARIEEATALQSAISEKKQQALIGQTVLAMVEGKSAQDTSIMLARTYLQAPEVDGYVRIQNTTAKPGEFIMVEITGYDGYDLIASPCVTETDL